MSYLTPAHQKKEAPVASLRTNMEASDIIVDCYQGHILLVEFPKLYTLARMYPGAFVQSFREAVHACIEWKIKDWLSSESISVRSGWTGNLLLMGFRSPMPEPVFEGRLRDLFRAMSSAKTIKFTDQEDRSTEVHLKAIKPIYSMVTQPRLRPYADIAKHLINDLQNRKLATTQRTLFAPEQTSSARWRNNGQNVFATEGAATPQDQNANYQEVTKRFLRRSFKSRKLEVRAHPVTETLTRRWSGFSVGIQRLSTMNRKTDIAGDSLYQMCDSLGMRWELEAALVDQTLADIKKAEDAYPCAAQPFLSLPVHFNTVLSWTQYPEDITTILDSHPKALVKRLVLVMTRINRSADLVDAEQLSEAFAWIGEISKAYGIKFYAQWDDAEISRLAQHYLPLSGIKLTPPSDDREGICAKTRAVMRSRNRYNADMKIILAKGFPQDIQRVARNSGVEFIESDMPGCPEGATFKHAMALLSSWRNSASDSIEIIDARARFASGKTPAIERSFEQGENHHE